MEIKKNVTERGREGQKWPESVMIFVRHTTNEKKNDLEQLNYCVRSTHKTKKKN